MGCVDSASAFIVRRPCIVFWLAIVVSILLGAGGVFLMVTPGIGQGKIFADQGDFDWLVTGALTVDHMDMVRLAEEATEADDEDGETSEIARQSEEAQGNYTTTFMYYWKDSGKNSELFTPAVLKQICEVENVLLGTPGYGDVCFNDPSAVFKTSANGSDCALPRLSAASLFYVPWSSPTEASARASFMTPAQQRMAELYAGMPFSGGYKNMPLASKKTFWNNGSHTRDCVLLDGDYTAERAQWLYTVANSDDVAVRAAVGFYISPDALGSKRTLNTRSMIPLGAPVLSDEGKLVDPYEAGKHDDFVDAVKGRLFGFFGMKNGYMSSPWRKKAETDDLTVRFLSGAMVGGEFDDLMNSDFTMVLASMAFVLFYICFHTGSLALGLLGMLMIILSLPASIFFYVVLRVQYFAMIHILAVFIVLGIGADDIFVFADAWRQSASMHPSISGSLSTRMRFAYSRTAQAVFNTSFTTAIAFIATGVSPVMPVAAFGYYAAIAILMNYVLAITFLPATFVIWEVYFRKAKCIGCCCPCIGPCSLPSNQLSIRPPVSESIDRVKDGKPNPTSASLDANESVQFSEASRVERVFSHAYAPLLNMSIRSKSDKTWIKPISIALVVVLGALGAYLATEATQLAAPTREEEFFPSDHMVTGFGDKAQTDFLTGSDNQYLQAGVYIGLKDIYRTDYSRWIPAENRGSVVYDEAFDLSTASAQTAFKQLCDDLKVAECDSDGCNKIANRLVDAASVRCLLEEFEEWNGGAEVGSTFFGKLAEWVALAPTSRGKLAGIIDGELKFVQITFTSTLLRNAPPYIVREVYDEWERFISSELATAPPELASCDPDTDRCSLFVFGGRAFAWMVTQERLVQGLFSGLGICAPVAFFVLLLATGNILVALYAILTIFLVVISLLGTCNLIGWELGIAEAIAGTIVIGLAVDYTVHLGHVYTEAHETTREGKMATAASIMGVTVVAGALTTFGCAFFMFFCQLTFFTKMATLIGGTIGYSVLYSLFFFMPLLALLGPSGRMRTTPEQCRRAYHYLSGKKSGAHQPEQRTVA